MLSSLMHPRASDALKRRAKNANKIENKNKQTPNQQPKCSGELHESQHLWCSKINCGSTTCLFVQRKRRRRRRRSISYKKHIYSQCKNIHTQHIILKIFSYCISINNTNPIYNVSTIRFGIASVDVQHGKTTKTTTVAAAAATAATAFFQFINRLHLSE